MRSAEKVLRVTIGLFTIWLCGAYASASPLTASGDDHATSAQAQERPQGAFPDDPVAHALYDKMIAAVRSAKTLSYQSDYHLGSRGRESSHCTYTVWLKKPNYFRLEAVSCLDKSFGGVIVGDGDFLWLYWPNGRPHFYPDDADSTQDRFLNVYMKEPAPPGRHSIGHQTQLLGVNMSMPIMDLSTFHGYTDSLQPYLDAVRSLGTEKVGDEDCDLLEASIMKGQRTWTLWLSRKDHLPRKLKEVTHVSYDIVTNETWSKVVLDAEMADDMFRWQPPSGWQQWRQPDPDQLLLKPGTVAPDFTLKSVDGATVKLSDLRGKVVWLYIWRYG